ncbi:MAG TPA: DUF4124 domain-containing protein [Methylophilaceae bacterium]|nr:DUF4124 domain-containing protein [Methylophilaceae bacterium]
MKLTWMILILALPLSAQAEIYKYKDKNGVMRYSDIRPPANVPYESMSGKKIVNQPAPTVPVEAAPAKAGEGTESAAIKRQQEAEDAKKKDEAKQAELATKQQNCSTAQANLQNYKAGGRIYKMNEKGEREYLDDAAIASKLDEAQRQVDQFCQ